MQACMMRRFQTSRTGVYCIIAITLNNIEAIFLNFFIHSSTASSAYGDDFFSTTDLG